MSQPDVLDPEAAAFDAMLERGISSLRSTARRTRSAQLFNAVPVIGRWTMPAPDGSDVPMPVLRVSLRRPEVADLARVVCTEEPGGAVWAAWRWVPGHPFTADRLTLDVKIMRPVRTAFLLAFTLPRD